MALSALDCPDGFCHSHHGGHHVVREQVEKQLSNHGESWCEKVAERTYEIAVDSFSQMVMPSLHQQGWQPTIAERGNQERHKSRRRQV